MSVTFQNLYRNTKGNVSKCPICEAVFSENNQFLEHLSLHTKKEQLTEITKEDGEHYKHMEQKLTSQTEGVSISCPICDEIVSDHYNLKIHLQLHTKNLIVPGELCEVILKEPTEINTNLLSHKEKKSLNPIKGDSLNKETTEFGQGQLLKCSTNETLMLSNSNSTPKYNDKSEQYICTDPVEEPMPCPICSLVFKEPLELQRHLLIHAENISISCPICNDIFINPTELKCHLITHADKVPIKCPICKVLFKELSMLKLHLLTHSEKAPIRCTSCDFKSSEPMELIMHLGNHAEKLTISCPICGDKYTNPAELKLHIMLHVDDKSSSCSCDNCVSINGNQSMIASNKSASPCIKSYFTIKEYTELNVHITPPIDKTTFKKFFRVHYTCDICNDKYDSNSQLIKHWNVHFKNIYFCLNCCDYYSEMELINSVNSCLKYFKCPVCDKALIKNWKCTECSISNVDWRTMKKCAIEIGITPKSLKACLPGNSKRNIFKCEICSLTFQLKLQLKEHLSCHLIKKFTCTLCSRTFPDVENLTGHSLWKHSELNYFMCPICDTELSKNKHTFVSHLKSHSFIKPYKCVLCYLPFTDKYRLNTHYKEDHPIDKQYQCKYCSKLFKRRKDMRICRMVHEGRQPCQCGFCSASFANKNQLDSHVLEEHPDEKPFKCTICSCAYSTLVTLKAHSKIHTRKLSLSCDICGYKTNIKTKLRDHMLRVHLNEDAFNCSLCNRAFSSQGSLNSHKHNASCNSGR